MKRLIYFFILLISFAISSVSFTQSDSYIFVEFTEEIKENDQIQLTFVRSGSMDSTLIKVNPESKEKYVKAPLIPGNYKVTCSINKQPLIRMEGVIVNKNKITFIQFDHSPKNSKKKKK